MPRVFIPPLLRPFAGGVESVDVDATNVRQAIAELDARFHGIGARLCEGDRLKSGLTVAINGNVSSRGLLEKLPPDAEVHFLPAIGGG
jgi:molybdopterin converting factor small subunit